MKSTKYVAFFVLLVCIILSILSCKSTPFESKPADSKEWQKALQSKLAAFGHRNWILIVDEAFPMQNGSGITYINSNEKLIPVLSYTLAEINNSSHVKPIIYHDKELSFIAEAQSRGVGKFSDSVNKVFGNNKVHQITHDSIFLKIDEAAKLFNVLIIKTNETIPYSSVFLQLDCAYWNDEKEAMLRLNMKK
jgi:D-ribose pyranose/furanose isomerase RbsD